MAKSPAAEPVCTGRHMPLICGTRSVCLKARCSISLPVFTQKLRLAVNATVDFVIDVFDTSTDQMRGYLVKHSIRVNLDGDFLSVAGAGQADVNARESSADGTSKRMS